MVNPRNPTPSSESDAPPRRRGRPAGKNRVPLSREERRARNAQYERERRTEMADVMSQLIEAAHCDSSVSNSDLLATVISRIQGASRKEDITELNRLNTNLESQIATLQERLGLDDAALELLDCEVTDTKTGPHSDYKRQTKKKCDVENYNLRKQLQRKKRKRSEPLSSDDIQQEKRAKILSESSVDSGIDTRGHTVSPPAVCVQDQNNMQYLVPTEQQQLPVEIPEERWHCELHAHTNMQSEIYNEIYGSEPQCSAEAISEVLASLSAESQSLPSIETLIRSLVEVPSIVPPSLQPPDSEEVTQTETTCQQSISLPCDFNIEGVDQELSMDFLTNLETGLLSDLSSEEFIKIS